MAEQDPATRTVVISEVKNQLSDLVNGVFRKETRILLEKACITVDTLVCADDLIRPNQLDRERAEHFKILKEFGEAFKDIPVEELEREVSRALADVRAERRTEREHPESAY